MFSLPFILARASDAHQSRGFPWVFIVVFFVFVLLSRLSNWIRNMQEQSRRQQLKEQLQHSPRVPAPKPTEPARSARRPKATRAKIAAPRPPAVAPQPRPVAPPPLPRPAVVYETAPSRATAPSIFPTLLRDRAALRQQLILSEILSKPLSLRDE